MHERARLLLRTLIERYIADAQPVSSTELARAGRFGVSPATIRNELAALEAAGYLMQPHTSAGRIPTEKGYRAYVTDLMGKPELTRREQEFMKHRLRLLERRQDDLLQLVTQALAELSHTVSVGTQEGETAYRYGISDLLQQPEFTDQDRTHRVAAFFDDPQHYLERLTPTHRTVAAGGEREPAVYIGEAAALGKDFSVVVSHFETAQGVRGSFALVGPVRMHYERNVPLLAYVQKLLAGGLLGTVGFVSLFS